MLKRLQVAAALQNQAYFSAYSPSAAGNLNSTLKDNNIETKQYQPNVSIKTKCGFVTICGGENFELTCLFCTELFGNFEEFAEHMQICHLMLEDNEDILKNSGNKEQSSQNHTYQDDIIEEIIAEENEQHCLDYRDGNMAETDDTELSSNLEEEIDFFETQEEYFAAEEIEEKESDTKDALIDDNHNDDSMSQSEIIKFEVEQVQSDLENHSDFETNENENKEAIECLIDIYKQHPVLWNKKDEEYQNKNARNEAYMKITDLVKEHFNPNLTVGLIKKAICNLRFRFGKELRHMATSRQTKPSLWFFDRLSFIMESSHHLLNALGFNSNVIEEFEEEIEINSDFIELYKKSSCLWDRKNRDFRNRERRKEALSFIIQSIKHNWDVDLSKTIKQKVALIKFLSKREKLQYKNAHENDADIKMKPWYLEKLVFLKEANKMRIYKCDVCEEKFNNDTKYKLHMYGEHQIKAYFCETCHKAFSESRALKRHMNIHLDPEERKYVCDICGNRFADQVNCLVHRRRHTKNYTHTCKECGKGFVSSTELKAHMRNHSGETPYVCDICGKSFRFGSMFRSHRNRHLKNRVFKCDLCPKTFYDSNNRRNHMALHSNVRGHVCDICGKGFKIVNTLRQHKLIHSKEKKYKCKICGLRFAQGPGLHCHMKTHSVAPLEKPSILLEEG